MKSKYLDRLAKSMAFAAALGHPEPRSPDDLPIDLDDLERRLRAAATIRERKAGRK